MSDENKKLGTCDTSEGYTKPHVKTPGCVNWREQPAQGEPRSQGVCTATTEEMRASVGEGMSAEQLNPDLLNPANTKNWAEVIFLAYQQSREEGAKAAEAFSAQQKRELREERDALKLQLKQLNSMYRLRIEQCERAESALAEAQELLGVMYGWAKYGEESDHWYYSEEQAPGWKADSERASKLLGFKLKAKP